MHASRTGIDVGEVVEAEGFGKNMFEEQGVWVQAAACPSSPQFHPSEFSAATGAEMYAVRPVPAPLCPLLWLVRPPATPP